MVSSACISSQKWRFLSGTAQFSMRSASPKWQHKTDKSNASMFILWTPSSQLPHHYVVCQPLRSPCHWVVFIWLTKSCEFAKKKVMSSTIRKIRWLQGICLELLENEPSLNFDLGLLCVGIDFCHVLVLWQDSFLISWCNASRWASSEWNILSCQCRVLPPLNVVL